MTGALALTPDGVAHGQIVAFNGDWSVSFQPADSTSTFTVDAGDYITDEDCDDRDRARAQPLRAGSTYGHSL